MQMWQSDKKTLKSQWSSCVLSGSEQASLVSETLVAYFLDMSVCISPSCSAYSFLSLAVRLCTFFFNLSHPSNSMCMIHNSTHPPATCVFLLAGALCEQSGIMLPQNFPRIRFLCERTAYRKCYHIHLLIQTAAARIFCLQRLRQTTVIHTK